MSPLITAGIVYVIAGSLRFVRRRLYPGVVNASFDKTFGTLFVMGLVLLGFGLINLLYPSDYALIVLFVVLVGGTGYLMNSLDVFSKQNTKKEFDKN